MKSPCNESSSCLVINGSNIEYVSNSTVNNYAQFSYSLSSGSIIFKHIVHGFRNDFKVSFYPLNFLLVCRWIPLSNGNFSSVISPRLVPLAVKILTINKSLQVI